jgi:hypothetical protein
MCSSLCNTDVVVTDSCKYHGRGSRNTEPQSVGLGSQMALLLCPTFMMMGKEGP